MRQTCIGLVLVLGLATAAQAQTFNQGEPLRAVWEATTNEAAAQVNRYEVRLDADTAGTSVGLAYSYAIPQARLTVGAHTFRVRACNTNECGPDLTVTFSVIVPVPPTPGAPRNGIIQRVPVAVLTVPQAIEYAQSYALWAMGRYLTPSELGWLSARHPLVPPTRYTVLDVLDAAYAEIAERQ